MPYRNERLLIVDDEPAIRISLSSILDEIGYPVRAAENGIAALIELRKEIPDMILSDLNMPCMSGFEFLSVVRRRFPAIPVIAMSGAFSGNEVPSGVAADAFYQKGSDIRGLLKIMESLTPPNRIPVRRQFPIAPLVIQRNGHHASGEPYVTIDCPECLRPFDQFADGSLGVVREANCVHCRNPICYTIVDPFDGAPAQTSRSREATPDSRLLD